jgi:serine/threonine-protein kinase RsbW
VTCLLVAHEAYSAAHVRHELRRELQALELAPSTIDDALLVVTELVGNAVRHGRPLPDGAVEVSWEVTDTVVHLEVCDGGPGLALAGVPTVPAEANARLERGRGLPIVEELSSRWGTTPAHPSGGCSVYAEVPVRSAVAARPA